MRKLSKLFLLFLFIAVSGMCQAQTFTVSEFIDLSNKNQDQLKNIIENKGYKFTLTETSDMSKNDIYSGDDNTNISIITPNFENGQNLISWEFIGMNNVYNDLQKQLESSGYKRLEREVRNNGRYIVSTYQGDNVTITLSSDKLNNNKGVYRLSVRYSNPTSERSTK